jgi:hypothetical protein
MTLEGYQSDQLQSKDHKGGGVIIQATSDECGISNLFSNIRLSKSISAITFAI